METQTIRTPIARNAALIDRRSLSQAWYSALHFIERTTAERRSAPVRTPAGFVKASSPHARGGTATRAMPERPGGAHAFERRARGVPSAPQPRVRPLPLACRAAAPLAARVPESGAGVTVTVRGARVHVLIRRREDGVRIIALCARRHEAAVRRALLFAAAEGAVRCGLVVLGDRA